MFKLNRVRWSLRKATLPVSGADLVLDVGAGGNPYPRSDVLLDRLTGSEHRCGESMMIDRPVIFGDASKMPFKDNAFDFVIASHILEHMAEPEIFLKELQRVGKAGYIETPNAIFERLYPYDIHCLEIILNHDVLHIHKKRGPVEDSFLGTQNLLDDDAIWGKYMYDSPEMFHVRYFWNNEINFEINNPEVSAHWIEEINANSEVGETKDSYLLAKSGWRAYGLAILNRWHVYQRARRLKDFNLLSILACPECSGELNQDKQLLVCSNCRNTYPYNNGIPDFTIAAPYPPQGT